MRAATILFLLLTTPALAQLTAVGGGPIEIRPTDNNEAEIDAVHRKSVDRARALGLPLTDSRAEAPTLQFPVRLRSNSKSFNGQFTSNYVDLDATRKIKDYSCGRRSYNGHNGIDIALTPFSWRMMDAKEAEIVAAAPGNIVDKRDGNFDRVCTTGGNPPSNYVVVKHDGGRFGYYWHMKKGSVTKRPIGSRVAAGEVLGLVGSSGNSTGPHLHFELRSASDFGGKVRDPYAGLCGAASTMWRHQPERADAEVLRIATHTVVPNPAPDWCSNPRPGYSNRFAPGSRVWVAAYVRDQGPKTPIEFKVLNPAGETYVSWTSGPLTKVYPWTYWYGQIDLPSTGHRGRWKVQVTLEEKTSEHGFMLGSLPKPTTLTTSVRPRSAVTIPGSAANFSVLVSNTGATTAVSCSVATDTPLAAVSTFQVMKGATPQGAANQVFDIGAGKTKKIRLSVNPKRTYRANKVQIPVRVFCSNGSEAAAQRAKVITLSF